MQNVVTLALHEVALVLVNVVDVAALELAVLRD